MAPGFYGRSVGISPLTLLRPRAAGALDSLSHAVIIAHRCPDCNANRRRRNVRVVAGHQPPLCWPLAPSRATEDGPLSPGPGGRGEGLAAIITSARISLRSGEAFFFSAATGEDGGRAAGTQDSHADALALLLSLLLPTADASPAVKNRLQRSISIGRAAGLASTPWQCRHMLDPAAAPWS